MIVTIQPISFLQSTCHPTKIPFTRYAISIANRNLNSHLIWLSLHVYAYHFYHFTWKTSLIVNSSDTFSDKSLVFYFLFSVFGLVKPLADVSKKSHKTRFSTPKCVRKASFESHKLHGTGWWCWKAVLFLQAQSFWLFRFIISGKSSSVHYKQRRGVRNKSEKLCN